MRRISRATITLLGAAALWQAGSLAARAIPGCHGDRLEYCAPGCVATSSGAWSCCYNPAGGYCCQYDCYTIYCDGDGCVPPPNPKEILKPGQPKAGSCTIGGTYSGQ